MKLICVGTGSSGNSYILTNGEESLVLDCGIRFLETKKVLNFQIKSIRAALVTHIHGDHHAFAHEYETAGIPVWKPYMTESLRESAQFGGFKVRSFDVVHSVPCCGYLIEHKDIGKMLYVTDAEYIKYRFKGINTMLIEANYSTELLHREEAKTAHVVTGHMNLSTAVSFIEANKNNDLNHIILCHLSEDNADPKAFQKAVMDVAPAGCTVDVAVPGLTVNLGDVPF